MSAFCGSASATEQLPNVHPDDPTQVQYTSGTTGVPKGAVLHHRGLTNNARFIAGRLEVYGDDVWVNPNPLFHVSGSGFCNLGALTSKAIQVLCPFDATLILDLVEMEKATVLSLPPTMLDGVLARPELRTRDH